MRSTRLANIALQAEKVRLQRRVQHYRTRAILGVVAGVLGLLALIFIHIAGYDALTLVVAPHWAALIVVGVDAVLAILLLVMAIRDVPDPVEREAIQVRDQAWAQIKDTMALTALVGPLGRVLGKRHVYGLTLAALTARFLSRP